MAAERAAAISAAVSEAPARRARRIRRLGKRLWRLRIGVLGTAAVLLVVIAAVFAPIVAPHDPYEQNIAARLSPPVWAPDGTTDHILGTDRVGRDVVSRIIYGSRISLSVGVLAVTIALTVGVLLGLLGGYYGKTVDAVVSGLVNLMMAFPTMLLAIATVAVVGPSFQNMIVVMGLTGWPIYTRVVRSETLRIREMDYITAARAVGLDSVRIMRHHVLPNLINSIVVIGSLEVARMILLESFLSFLGLGVQPPTPSWGGMLNEGRLYIFNMWWLATFPGIAIFCTTLGINLMGDAIRDLLDPRLRNL